MNKKLTHLDSQGNAKMVDISEKQVVRRTARAEGRVRLSPGTSQLILEAGLGSPNW